MLGTLIGGAMGLAGGLFGRKDPLAAYKNAMRGYALGQMRDSTIPNWYRNAMLGGGQGLSILLGENPELLNKMVAPEMGLLNTQNQYGMNMAMNNATKYLNLAGGMGNNRSMFKYIDTAGQQNNWYSQMMQGILSGAYNRAGSLVNYGMQGAGGMDAHTANIMGLLTSAISGAGAPQANSNPFGAMLGGLVQGTGLEGFLGGGGQTGGQSSLPADRPR